MWRKYFHDDVMMMYYMLKCFKYVVMFYIFTSYKHDHDVQVMMFKFYVQIYDHEACHLIKQVITKLKAVSYRPFSLCRPKGIKETGFPCYVCFCLTHRGFATLA